MRQRIAVATTCVLLVAGMLGLAAPVGTAAGVETVKGKLSEFSAGITAGYDIWGPARLKRGADWTSLKVNVKGLAPNTTYASHLHSQACADGDGGGHYMNDSLGAAAPPNELWLTLETNAAGRAKDSSTAPWRVLDGARSVVIHDTDGSRIACADLPVG